MPWPIRSVLAGTAGTAALSAAYTIEHRLRPAASGPLDYDDGLVPGEIVASIMHLGAVSADEEHELGLALRWSYGSAFGLWHGILRRRMGEPWAALAFGTTLMTATLTMFPLLGHTPPPWRWSSGVILTSFGTHIVYATTVARIDDRLRA